MENGNRSRPSHATLAAMALDLVAKGNRKLLITSCGRGEGKSWVAAEAAREVAASGQESVLLIDADQFKPGLHSQLRLPLGRGLSEALEEVYLFDITKEDPHQFGVGDWLEILRAQRRTGELSITEDERRYGIHLVKGSIVGISSPEAGESRLGELLIRRGLITPEQAKTAVTVHQETGRPVGDIVKSLGWVTGEDLSAALSTQVDERLTSLLGLRQPEGRFVETAEPFLPASGGRTAGRPDKQTLDEQTFRRLAPYLKGPFLGSQLPSFLTDTPMRNLKVLTAGKRACDLVSPAYLGAFSLLVDRMARMFDLVMIDGPPISRLGPAGALAGLVDGVLLVIKAEGVEVEEIRRAVADLERAGGNVLGIVLNQADPLFALEGLGGRAPDHVH